MNVVVKGFLWGQEAEAFEAEITLGEYLDKEVEEIQGYRNKGRLGKLVNSLT